MPLPNDLKFWDSDDQPFSVCDWYSIIWNHKKVGTWSMTSGLFQLLRHDDRLSLQTNTQLNLLLLLFVFCTLHPLMTSKKQAITSFRNLLDFSIKISACHPLAWKPKIWSSFTYCTSYWYETDWTV